MADRGVPEVDPVVQTGMNPAVLAAEVVVLAVDQMEAVPLVALTGALVLRVRLPRKVLPSVFL